MTDIEELYEQYESKGYIECECGENIEIDCSKCGECGKPSRLLTAGYV